MDEYNPRVSRTKWKIKMSKEPGEFDTNATCYRFIDRQKLAATVVEPSASLKVPSPSKAGSEASLPWGRQCERKYMGNFKNKSELIFSPGTTVNQQPPTQSDMAQEEYSRD